MKNLLIFSILTYLLFTINSSAVIKNSKENIIEDEKILKIGVLLPLSGKFKDTGQSFLKAIQLALIDIGNKNIKIYPKDSKANSLDSYLSAKEFEKLGIEIVIGPIFYESLERLDELNNITFISLTNKTHKIPKNIIAFGINVNSQIDTLKKYFQKMKISKTLLLSPKSRFTNQVKIITDSKLKFYKVFSYDISPKKITSDIEQITNYQERKKNLERRIEILKKSDLYKDEKELEELKQKHTIGKVDFDSVIVVDFGERLKSILTSFLFSDISSDDVIFFTLNQWFDETLFNENASKNLHFPAVDFDNLKKFKKKYLNTYKEKPNNVSILAYDALGLIYYCWVNNNTQFETKQLYNKNGFRGLHGKFTIKNNLSKHQLRIYRVHEKKFFKVY